MECANSQTCKQWLEIGRLHIVCDYMRDRKAEGCVLLEVPDGLLK